jgi:hypothetical protein
MFSDVIEKMKREYTDKYVLVDAARPELARFRDVVGRVKTVNMNGRALVEFDEYHVNIGWYDIDPEFLKVVDKPPPQPVKVEAKKAAPKAAPAAKEKPAAKAAPAAGAAKAGKTSVADMLAAARAGGAAKAGGPAAAVPTKAKSEVAPAVAKPDALKVDRSKMSVADMLAAARAGGAPGAAPAAPKPVAPAEEVQEAAAPVQEPAKKATPAAKSGEKVDKSKMTIDDIIAWCRAHDAK